MDRVTGNFNNSVDWVTPIAFPGFVSSSIVVLMKCWLINSHGLAKKVMNASLPAEDQIKDCGGSRCCPNCTYLIDNSDVSQEWPGLPVGVKFEPSDVELLHHLAAKQGKGDVQPHVYIDEYIPTIEGEDGICYTHPENLPGAKRDGSFVHFFYRVSKAYASGKRKRRRIQEEESALYGHVRWHKTGKTKPVMENGVQKGFKKIMVLYATTKKGSKPDKCNWVMHQYHLGPDEVEKDGEFVVSKIFYQPQKDSDKVEALCVKEESDIRTGQPYPSTPNTTTPDLDRLEKTPSSDCLYDDYFMDTQSLEDLFGPSYNPRFEDDLDYTRLAAEYEPFCLTQPIPRPCNKAIEFSHTVDDSPAKIPSPGEVDSNLHCGISDLEDIVVDTPPDFKLDELNFPSQDSVFDWTDQV